MVIDFNHLKVITNGIAEKWDHQFINECPELRGEEPTAEHLAIILYGMIQDELNRVEAGPGQSLRLVAVTVEEAPGHKVTYSP
jgi:6-pyruvoyl-tetrahydropterin synthase